MSKKQILKNIEKNSKKNNVLKQADGFYKFVTTITVILLTLILCYLLIGLFGTKEINLNNKNKNDKKDETKEVSIDNTIITGGQIFDQKDNAYYVVVYDLDSKLLNLSSWISNYTSKENSIPVYKVDSSKKFNSRYIVKENSNKNPASYSDLKIISPTLMKIENNVVTSYVEGEDNIKSVFQEK